MQEYLCPSIRVRNSSLYVVQNSTHVKILKKGLEDISSWLIENHKYTEFSESSQHPTTSNFSLEEIIKFYFVADSMNFCFWPNKFEYEDMIVFITKIFKNDPGFFAFKTFETISIEVFKEKFSEIFKDERNQLPERLRILKELFVFIEIRYNGSFFNLLKDCKSDCQIFLKTIVDNLPNFQDHSVYKGRQVFFYKRAQILTADINEALKAFYKHKKDSLLEEERLFFQVFNPNGFERTGLLTCFPDYRVPQVLDFFGVLQYDHSLKEKIEKQIELTPGSEEECEIRAATIFAVNELVKMTKEKLNFIDIQIDWLFWQFGENNLNKIPQFHRVLTVYY